MRRIRNLFSIILLLSQCYGCAKSTLAEVVCQPGVLKCEDEGVKQCNIDGSAWMPGVCDEGYVCVENGDCDDDPTCGDACEPKVCEPEQLVCGDNQVYVYECDESGTRMCYSHSCSNEGQDGVCFNGECVSVCSPVQKEYYGCEFYAVDLDNADVPCGSDIFGNTRYCDASNSQFAVVLSNPEVAKSAYVLISTDVFKEPTLGTDECGQPVSPDGFVDASVIPPQGIQIFELPARNVNGTTKAKLAYRVVSNIPISAYQFNPLENVDVFSNDASLLLPTTTAGMDFWVMSREQTFDELKAYFTVVGVDPVPANIKVTVTTRTLPGNGIPSLKPGETYETSLAQFEVLNIESNFIGGDFTGSRVISDRGVLVYAGSEAANTPNTSRCDVVNQHCENDPSIACNTPEQKPPACTTDPTLSICSPHIPCSVTSLITCCADHLEQQLFPVTNWDREYLAVRSQPRGQELDAWRIMASQDGTVVRTGDLAVDGETSVVEAGHGGTDDPVNSQRLLNAGEWFEFEANADFLIKATKPIMVGQFLAAEQAPGPGRGEGDAGIGDPAFILSVPKRQFRKDYIFLAPNKYEEDYVSIALRHGTLALLDGLSVFESSAFKTAEIVGAPGWLAVRGPVADGFHTLSCSEACSVMVHGYDSYVSYGYPGGLNLLD
ncbi:MAG: IgGFc-binding protein [Myxococcota bacterium]|nr:IgGFc-binding protein [Myxococcota bacterium]